LADAAALFLSLYYYFCLLAPMAPRTRQARRSHANHATQSDELADTEYTGPRMPSKASSKPPTRSTIPKRRGRPPGSKNRPKVITTTSQRQRRGSRRPGRPPGSAIGNIEPPHMPHKQIAQALHMWNNESTTDERVGTASKKSLALYETMALEMGCSFSSQEKVECYYGSNSGTASQRNL
jgi:hypothetical protein